jgi:hypothetical protein
MRTMPRLVGDEAGALQCPRGQRDARPVGAQQVGQGLVRERERLLTAAVVQHEQPPAQPCIDRVLDIAGDRLLRLVHQDFASFHDQRTGLLAAAELLPDATDLGAQREPTDLHDASHDGLATAHARKQPESAFAAHHRRDDGGAVTQDGQQREDARDREVGVAQGLPGLDEQLIALQLDLFAATENARAACAVHGGENTILQLDTHAALPCLRCIGAG